MPKNDLQAARHVLVLASAMKLCAIPGPHSSKLEKLLNGHDVSIDTLRAGLGQAIAAYASVEPVTVHYPLCRPGSAIPLVVTVRSGELSQPGEVSFHRGQIDATVEGAVVVSLDSEGLARAWANKSHAIAKGVGSRAEAWGKGSEAHAVASGTTACAEEEDASAWADEAYAIAYAKHSKSTVYATKSEAKAVAEAPNSTAIGMKAGTMVVAEKDALAVAYAAYTQLIVRDGACGKLVPYARAQSDGRATIFYGGKTLTLAKGNVIKGLAKDYYRYQPSIDSEKHYIQAGRERFVKRVGDKKTKLGEGAMGAAYAYKKSDLVSKIETDPSGASLNKKLAADLAETYRSISQTAPWLLSYISVPTVMVKPNGQKVAHQPLIDGNDLSSVRHKLRPLAKEAILEKMLVVTRHAHNHGLHLTDQKNWMILAPTKRDDEYRIGRLDIDADPRMNHGGIFFMFSELPGSRMGKENAVYNRELLFLCQHRIAKEYGIQEMQAMGQLLSIVGPFAALHIDGKSLNASSYFGVPRATMGQFIDSWRNGTATQKQVMEIYRAWRAWHPAPLNPNLGAVHPESAGALPQPLPPTPVPKFIASPTAPQRKAETPHDAVDGGMRHTPGAITGKPPRPPINNKTKPALERPEMPPMPALRPASGVHPVAKSKAKPRRPDISEAKKAQPVAAPRPLSPRPPFLQPIEPLAVKTGRLPPNPVASPPPARVTWETEV
ncbi:hypothetical protein [Chromobacterium sp. ASV23]|uniref:hypothetical protein n=1 Tax=Chromobacterium sp. ASV23 TaxID=2795110 RepID=UPI0018EC6A5C|nr:hypothetical protein [Chromobacterium sp. ASV23]